MCNVFSFAAEALEDTVDEHVMIETSIQQTAELLQKGEMIWSCCLINTFYFPRKSVCFVCLYFHSVLTYFYIVMDLVLFFYSQTVKQVTFILTIHVPFFYFCCSSHGKSYWTFNIRFGSNSSYQQGEMFLTLNFLSHTDGKGAGHVNTVGWQL